MNIYIYTYICIYIYIYTQHHDAATAASTKTTAAISTGTTMAVATAGLARRTTALGTLEGHAQRVRREVPTGHRGSNEVPVTGYNYEHQLSK